MVAKKIHQITSVSGNWYAVFDAGDSRVRSSRVVCWAVIETDDWDYPSVCGMVVTGGIIDAAEVMDGFLRYEEE